MLRDCVLEQIFATTGDRTQGQTHVLYDPTLSERGALVCVARAPRKKSVDDFELKPMIHNPHALPLFRDQPSRKRQREKMLKDPFKSHKPELPMTGPGHGGRVGTTQGSLLTQYLLKVKKIIFLQTFSLGISHFLPFLLLFLNLTKKCCCFLNLTILIFCLFKEKTCSCYCLGV